MRATCAAAAALYQLRSSHIIVILCHCKNSANFWESLCPNRMSPVKTHVQRHISWNDSHCPKLWPFSCTLHTSTHPKPIKIAFLGPAKLHANNFDADHHQDTDSRLLFHKWSNSVQDKWPKGCTKKEHFCTVWWDTWGDFPQIFAWYPTVVPHSLIFRVLSELVWAWGVNPSVADQSDCTIGSFKPIINRHIIAEKCFFSHEMETNTIPGQCQKQTRKLAVTNRLWVSCSSKKKTTKETVSKRYALHEI